MTDPVQYMSSIDLAEQDILRASERWVRENEQVVRYPTPQWVKDAITERDGKGCQLCGDRRGTLELDHIKPRSAFKRWELALADRSTNLQWLCTHCNRAKSNRRVVFGPRIGVTATCVQCAPPADWADSGDRIAAWCRRCGSSHVESEEQIR